MAIRSEYIDPTDERIQQICCEGCFHLIWVEKGSECALAHLCDRCLGLRLKCIEKALRIS